MLGQIIEHDQERFLGPFFRRHHTFASSSWVVNRLHTVLSTRPPKKKRESTSRTRVYSDRRIPTHRTVLSQGSPETTAVCRSPTALPKKKNGVSEMEKATHTSPRCAKKEAKVNTEVVIRRKLLLSYWVPPSSAACQGVGEMRANLHTPLCRSCCERVRVRVKEEVFRRTERASLCWVPISHDTPRHHTAAALHDRRFNDHRRRRRSFTVCPTDDDDDDGDDSKENLQRSFFSAIHS